MGPELSDPLEAPLLTGVGLSSLGGLNLQVGPEAKGGKCSPYPGAIWVRAQVPSHLQPWSYYSPVVPPLDHGSWLKENQREGVSLHLELFFFFLVVLGLELRAFTLSYSTSPIFVMGFSR
jgi:hypothetical protein